MDLSMCCVCYLPWVCAAVAVWGCRLHAPPALVSRPRPPTALSGTGSRPASCCCALFLLLPSAADPAAQPAESLTARCFRDRSASACWIWAGVLVIHLEAFPSLCHLICKVVLFLISSFWFLDSQRAQSCVTMFSHVEPVIWTVVTV